METTQNTANTNVSQTKPKLSPGDQARLNLSKVDKRKVGRPKGFKEPHSILRDRTKQKFNERVMKMANRLFNAQASIALGQQFLYRIDKEEIVGPKGGLSYRPKPAVIVTDPEEIQRYIDGETGAGERLNDPTDRASSYWYITAKEANNMALDSMLNRAYGRAKESLEVSGEVKFSLKELAKRIDRPLLQNPVQDAEIIEDQNNG